MSEQLPILDELEAAATFSAIAEWLTQCPLAVFASHGHEIEAIVARRGFSSAKNYVQTYMATVHSTRYQRFKPGAIEADDANGSHSKGLLASARNLDDAADLVGWRDLSWHKVHSDTRTATSEAGHAG